MAEAQGAHVNALDARLCETFGERIATVEVQPRRAGLGNQAAEQVGDSGAAANDQPGSTLLQ